MGPKLTCREFIDFLSDYLDGELAPPRRRAFDTHLDVCPACTDYLESFRETLRLGRIAFCDPDGPPPADAPAQLVQAILTALRE